MVAAAAWRAAEELALAAMRLSFREGRDLGEPPAVEEAAARAGIDVGELRRVVEDDRIKAALREATDVALARGVVGVPTVMVGEELFWGDDRLEAADDHARARADG